jgi:RHS repeat-associated protein
MGGLSVGFQYDPVGNLTQLTPAASATPLVKFDYDALSRLTKFKDGPTDVAIESYAYDATGNRQSFTNSAGTQAYSYPSTSHRLNQVGATVRTYDNAGNTTAIGGTAKEFVYDDTGRMSQVKQNAIVQRSYAYNGKGEQVRKSLASNNTYTVYDEAGHWLGDYDNTGAALQQAIWLDDLPVGLIANGNQLHYVEPDHLGTPRVVIEVARNVPVWTWDLKSEAFGNSVPAQDSDGDSIPLIFDMRFPGQRYDAVSGLNQNGNRDYDSGSGRYPQSDPVGLRGGINTYSYAYSNPLMWIDPDGLQAIPIPMGPGMTGAAGAAGAYNPSNPYVTENQGPTISSLIDSISQAMSGRPHGLSPSQISIYDTVCKGQDDKCSALKAAIKLRISAAQRKSSKMLFDKTLYENAFRFPNKAVTGTNTTWLGHVDDLSGLIAKIRTMIELGKIMGCDMNEEEQMFKYLFVPKSPFGY